MPNKCENRDKDFFIAQRMDQASGMKEAYQVCIKVCPIWKRIDARPEMSRKNIKNRNSFLYIENLKKQCRLVLPSSFDVEGKNFVGIAIAEAVKAQVRDLRYNKRQAIS